MTRLPHESRLVLDRPDLPEYELNKACPVTGEVTGLENHHLWPRSFGTKSWWVELPDGTVVGNRINLSPSAHYRVTVNKARIVAEPAQNGRPTFFWVENGEKTRLKWQPPSYINDGLDVIRVSEQTLRESLAQRDVSYKAGWETIGAETPNVPDRDVEHPEPGQECKLCHRRVPHPKKKTSPLTKVFSTRVPIGDADTFSELVDAAAEHAGLKSKPHHVYNTLLIGLTLMLQAPKEHLP